MTHLISVGACPRRKVGRFISAVGSALAPKGIPVQDGHHGPHGSCPVEFMMRRGGLLS